MMTIDIFIKLSKPPGVALSHEKPSIVEIVLLLASFYAATEPAMYINTTATLAFCGGKSPSCYGGKGKI